MPLHRSLAETFAAHGDALKNEIKKCVPATITAVHASSQTVDVQVAILNVVFDDLGNAYQEPALSFSNVPLGTMRGGGFFIWVPVQVGDSVLLIYSDLSADTWRAGDGNPQPPGWMGKHTCDSPFAIPCIAPDSKALTTADANKVVIGKDGGAAQIKISATDIELGASAADHVALAAKLDSLINILAPLVPYTPGPTSGSLLVAALATWQLANWPVASTVGSSLIKGQ